MRWPDLNCRIQKSPGPNGRGSGEAKSVLFYTFGAADLIASLALSAKVSKFLWNSPARLAAASLNAALSSQVFSGTSTSLGTPGQLVGTPTPNTGSADVSMFSTDWRDRLSAEDAQRVEEHVVKRCEEQTAKILTNQDIVGFAKEALSELQDQSE